MCISRLKRLFDSQKLANQIVAIFVIMNVFIQICIFATFQTQIDIQKGVFKGAEEFSQDQLMGGT